MTEHKPVNLYRRSRSKDDPCELAIADTALRYGCRLVSALNELPLALKHRVRMSDTGQVVVLTDTGQPAVDETGRPLSVDQLVVDHVRAHPYYLDPDSRHLWP